MRGHTVPLQPTTRVAVRGVQAGSSPVCEPWRALCGMSSLPYTALSGVEIAAAGSKLASAQASTSVSSNGPMGVGGEGGSSSVWSSSKEQQLLTPRSAG